MNRPPSEFSRISHEDLHAFVSTAAQSVGLPQEKAELLASLLAGNDLRGVFSHGTQQIATYARLMRDGKLNNKPEIDVVESSPCSLLVDGGGGVGYFPAHEGTARVIEKAKENGIAVMVTRNHGHFGAAGLYSRMTLEHDLVTFVTSGVQQKLKPGDSIFSAGGGSPMSFSAPAGEEDSLVLDFGAMHDLYGGDPHSDEIARLAPGLVLRCIGMGEICQSWGGLLAGMSINPPAPWAFPGANQGSMVITFRIDLFIEPAAFKREMDEYVRRVGELTPLPGFDRSFLAGGAEAARERQYRQEGVPVGEEHRQILEELARDLGIGVPWQS